MRVPAKGADVLPDPAQSGLLVLQPEAVARGLTNREVAAELYLSTATVKAHLTRLMVKLDVANRTQVAVLLHAAE
ncbi:regulatory LuxR family protein [Kribbella sp. VKM Ac-2571]|uniref:helix-turn-helix domain-containing protein n=1 Tax=Kribbella sp. VKM Ac-2571 TaxID=2512222 RepID=UPI0010613E89|nr:LuxR C-terminal-related transcriptional regulator [Kribbella sp. VKM Ac-2571]TDO68330.1 regulatory LuxR family protein [Kribbella sp. VKM Ac-2571]